MIADQMIQRIEYIHSRSFLHRDVKPDNFLIGKGKKSHLIHIIDFGLAKRYWTTTGDHIPYVDNKSLTGTARYASVNTHEGIEQSRRDDLEGIFHVIMYLMKGSLPWMGLQAKSKKEKYDKIRDCKKHTKLEELCKGCSPAFIDFGKYVKNLTFEEKPDYAYCRKLFHNEMKLSNFKYDYEYDWVIKKSLKKD